MKKPAILFLIFGVLTISSILITPVQGRINYWCGMSRTFSGDCKQDGALQCKADFAATFSIFSSPKDCRCEALGGSDQRSCNCRILCIPTALVQKKREGSTWAWGYDDADSQTRYFGSKSFNIPCCHFDWVWPLSSFAFDLIWYLSSFHSN
ncbi:hypothetical protein NC653_002822 [Populus alba x Populus x berolinensis]|uniref:Uncharacterized protein n=1 Tax=Populus alba x Populus x berolinensis TaxID=444605 RepID=A0AAD6WHD6_9ROSI|nr:hypothetical protein NC653_002822 [Populus alba x Populus x berolinensis]